MVYKTFERRFIVILGLFMLDFLFHSFVHYYLLANIAITGSSHGMSYLGEITIMFESNFFAKHVY